MSSRKTKKLSPYLLTALTVLLVAMMAFTCACNPTAEDLSNNDDLSSATPFIKLSDREYKNVNIEDYFDPKVIQKLPTTVQDSEYISVILSTNDKNVLDSYDASGSILTLREYFASEDAVSIRRNIDTTNESILTDLTKKGVSYEKGVDYYTLLSGKEIVIKAKDFYDVCEIVGNRAQVIVSEVYETEAYENVLVNNTVNVYDTGIFNSANFPYQGEGTVVAVLDTGLDYYHTAFSTDNFRVKDENELGLTIGDVANVIDNTTASGMQAGLTANDVYISTKVPFAFDYADGDSDVYPLLSNHGTHVAGVIAGKDDVITGVAPDAQLAIMKIFSDVDAQARSSWILRALEDCVVLDVDIINMSIGTSCGFSRETDKEAVNGVYDRIRERGINMVVAASNSFNSTYGSEKNGNLGLTSNPDSATVSSPSTYKGALSIASINGAKTSYILYEGRIIYFIESTDRVAEEKSFVDDILGDNETEKTVEYVTIPGVGRTADYTGIDIRGKVALIARGSNTFEEKANTAQKQGAIGAIIYNNVSGDIRMNVGDTTIAVCSISQDDGELLASKSSGTITVSRSQASGPFMSDFSSWGPSPDLEIKPELTAHGGNILSSVPGQDYDEISGTSMATPNVSGLTALIRQYVKENFSSISNDNVEIAAMVNRLLMSTADIVYNTNGLPYSVRKQGSGLANVEDAASTGAVIYTYKNGALMDKSKIELGDDPQKTGVYEFSFDVYNFSNKTLSYDHSTIVMTEGVSETKTNQGDTTVTEDGYILEGAQVVINTVTGGGLNGQRVSVNAGQTATVTMTITLTNENKKYLDESFKNGMYVEGFVSLKGADGATDIGFPYLAFYGDWTVAPMFDLDYYQTNKDELDDSIDLLDKTLPDAYASRPVGGVYADYVSFLGTYYFEQNPSSTKISADRKYISLSNTEGTINKLSYAWMGMLRNAKEIDIVITDDATGEIVFAKTEKDIRKSFGDGGPIYPAQVKIGFTPADYNLPNNSTYTVTLNGRLDYGDGGVNTNLNNTFTFPLMVDFQAPAVEDVEFYTEYDKNEKKNRLFAKLAIYDNHYSMAALIGTISATSAGELSLNGFDHYLTPIYSDFNGTSYLTYELTDHLDTIKNSYNNIYKIFGNEQASKILTTPIFTVSLYDYALNNATYEIALPNKFIDGYFTETKITLSPNETYSLEPVVYPSTEWFEMMEFTSSNQDAVKVVSGTNKLVALSKGKSEVTATYKDVNGVKKEFSTIVEVLGPNDEGFRRIDEPVVHKFEVTGYHTNKAYYKIDSTEREIGQTGDDRTFPNKNNLSLTLYPSESVSLKYDLIAYFPNKTTVEYKSSNPDIVDVDAYGTITAKEEGFASITVNVLKDGKSTFYSKSIAISVENPYITTGPTLTNYYGLGGTVIIPESLAITEIGTFAFSNFDYVERTQEEKDKFEDEEAQTKQWFIGENTITEVIIPEGVKTISAYAFANLTALKRVELPSTLTTISYGAFYGCTSLTTIKGIEHVKFINQNAFAYCDITGTLTFDKTIAVSNYAFAYNTNLKKLVLSKNTQSIGQYAFVGNTSLETLTINAEKLKFGQFAFSDCSSLKSVSVNAAVIPAGLFENCTALNKVHFGKDVAVIGEYAFNNTALADVTVAPGNQYFYPVTNKPYMLNKDGTVLTFVTPDATKVVVSENTVTTIGSAALSGNTTIEIFRAPSVTRVLTHAFSGCENLEIIELGALTEIGKAAFMRTAITQMHSLDNLAPTQDDNGNTRIYLSDYAYYGTKITSVTVPDNIVVGAYAFSECRNLSTVEIGDNVTVEDNAFKLDWQLQANYMITELEKDHIDRMVYFYDLLSSLTSLTIGNDVTLGKGAFYGASKLTTVTLGNNVYIGDQAFYNTELLSNIDLSKATYIGKEAFSGVILSLIYYDPAQETVSNTIPKDVDGNYRYRVYTNKLTNITINAETIGEDAFAYNENLETVTLGATTKNINARAFASCPAIHTTNLENVVNIGSEAFAQTKLDSANLASAVNIDKFAFTEIETLLSVNFGANIETVGEGAFSYAKALATVNGEEKIKNIGNYAFAYTAINNVDLSSVVNLGNHAFLKETMSPFTVKLSDSIVEIGDNPFANCDVQGQFSTTVYTEFNGVKYEEVSYTYDISETVKIIDGSIYRVVPNGYELITFASADDYNVVLIDNTVRIGAMAFMGADVVNVSFPHTVASVGHKAFYDCAKLTIVTMQSYYAPVLEEEFDMIYAISGENAPMLDTDAENYGWDGLGIIKYYMWNMWDSANGIPVYSNFYYGANFINYIGKVNKSVVLVYPVNGENYDSFIMNQYFDIHIMGAAAADDITLAAIKAINDLPETIQLTDKAQVQMARVAYDKIASYEQRALVANYQKLTDAELRLKTLENLAGGGAEDTPDDNTVEENTNVTAMILAIVFTVLGVAGAVAYLIYLYIKGKIKLPAFTKKKATVKPLVPGANQKVVKKMVKKVIRRVVVYNPETDDYEEIDNVEDQINEQKTETETISEKEEDNE